MSISAPQESGRSMIEMLGVLALIGILSVGGIVGYASAMEKYRANKTLDEVQALITNIRGITDVRPIFEKTTTDMWYDMGVFADDNFDKDRNCGRNMFDGCITIETKPKDTLKNMLVITYTNVPIYACRKLAVLDWDGGNSERLVSFELGDRKYSWVAKTADRMLPVSLEESMDACNSNELTIIWNFRP